MSSKTRLFTLLAGAAALAGVTYGFGRLALRPRTLGAAAAQRAPSAGLASNAAPEVWESALDSLSSPTDALDLALSLDGVFDAPPDETPGVTVRSSDRVPPASGGDDEDPPSPDDLGRAWLAQATQSERSFTEADLSAELEQLAAADVSDEADDESSEASDDGARLSYG